MTTQLELCNQPILKAYRGVIHLVTPCSRGFLEKLTGSQLINKFSAFYGTRKFTTACLPPVPILSQFDPFHISISNFLTIHLNIIFTCMPVSPKWCFSLRFSNKSLYTPHLSPYELHARSISFFSECYRSNNSTLAPYHKVPVLLHKENFFTVHCHC